METIKRFIDCGIPTYACNFRCHYCYITQNYLFTQKVPKFKYSSDIVGKALSKSRLGGACLFNICASGETLIPNEVVSYIKAILKEGHYVMIVTNGIITKRLNEIASFPEDYRLRLFFKISFHYLELKKRNLLSFFFKNIELIKKMGASFTLEITPSDELIPYIDEIKKLSIENVGALPHITIARDESKPDYPILTRLSLEEYKKTWETFDSKLFDFKLSVFGEKRTEYCYAGNWSFTLNLLTGTMKQCYKTNFFANVYKHIDRPLKFVNIGHGCKAPHCHNAHAFLCLGTIPELQTPFYAELRNRICADGTEWLNPQMKSFLTTKLKDSNDIKQPKSDKIINVTYNILYHMLWLGRSVLKALVPTFKEQEKKLKQNG